MSRAAWFHVAIAASRGGRRGLRHDELADQSGWSDRTLDRLLPELLDLEVLARVQEDGIRGGYRYRYRLGEAWAPIVDAWLEIYRPPV